MTRFRGDITLWVRRLHDAQETQCPSAWRLAYAPEFRAQLIALVRAGRTPEELSREFKPSGQTIRNWVRQAERDVGTRTDGLTSAERRADRVAARESPGFGQVGVVLQVVERSPLPLVCVYRCDVAFALDDGAVRRGTRWRQVRFGRVLREPP